MKSLIILLMSNWTHLGWCPLVLWILKPQWVIFSSIVPFSDFRLWFKWALSWYPWSCIAAFYTAFCTTRPGNLSLESIGKARKTVFKISPNAVFGNTDRFGVMGDLVCLLLPSILVKYSKWCVFLLLCRFLPKTLKKKVGTGQLPSSSPITKVSFPAVH